MYSVKGGQKMKITVKITNYTPKPAKKTKSAIMKKYLAMTANEGRRYDNRILNIQSEER